MKSLAFVVILVTAGCTPNSPAPPQPPRADEQGKQQLGPPVKPSVRRQHPLSELEKVELTVEDKKIRAYVADDESKTTEGLMFVSDDELADDEGMMFIFPQPRELSFWMKNTLIPLDVAFLDENGKILNIITMQPLDETTQNRSAGPAKYALEMKAGWFERNNVRPGARVDLTPVR